MTKRERLEKKIKERCKNPCHRCGGMRFALFDGVGLKHRKLNDDEFTQDTILIVCDNCGAITEHLVFFLDRRKNGLTTSI